MRHLPIGCRVITKQWAPNFIFLIIIIILCRLAITMTRIHFQSLLRWVMEGVNVFLIIFVVISYFILFCWSQIFVQYNLVVKFIYKFYLLSLLLWECFFELGWCIFSAIVTFVVIDWGFPFFSLRYSCGFSYDISSVILGNIGSIFL